MTTETVSAAMVPLSNAWRSLLWFAPLTTLWILMIYRWPAIPASDVPTHDPPARGPRAHRAGIVARPRTHEPDARSTPRDLVGDLHSGHALVRRRLERGHQWRFPHGRLTLTGAAAGDLPASDHRRAAAAVVETGFVVPSSILLHALSLRQLRRRSKAEAARR